MKSDGGIVNESLTKKCRGRRPRRPVCVSTKVGATIGRPTANVNSLKQNQKMPSLCKGGVRQRLTEGL